MTDPYQGMGGRVGAAGGRPMFGKYRGKVIDNEDPLFLGRVLAMVAAVPGMEINWCLPCTPYAGAGVGFYAIPPIDANVWIEFEGGDVNYPIWVGCFWGEGETPIVTEEPPNPFIKTLKTQCMTLTLNDTPEVGGFTLTCIPPSVTTPLSMVFNSEGIKITAPPAMVSLITEQGITLEFPPDTITLTAEGVEILVAETVVSVTEALVSVEAPVISGVADEGVSFQAGADLNLAAAGAMAMEAGLDASFTGGAAVNIEAGGDVTVLGALVMVG